MYISMIYLFQRQSFFNCFLDDVHRKLKLLKVSKAKAQGAAQVASELHLKNLDERKDVAERMLKGLGRLSRSVRVGATRKKTVHKHNGTPS